MTSDEIRPAHLDEAWNLILTDDDDAAAEVVRWLVREYDPHAIITAMAAATVAMTSFIAAVGADPSVLARRQADAFRAAYPQPSTDWNHNDL